MLKEIKDEIKEIYPRGNIKAYYVAGGDVLVIKDIDIFKTKVMYNFREKRLSVFRGSKSRTLYIDQQRRDIHKTFIKIFIEMYE